MREIKFRARSKDGIWYYSDRCGLDLFFALCLSKNLEAQEYIGLKDKNGVEIYEGDILAYGGDNHNGVVVWDDDFGVPGFHTQEGARLRGDDKVKRIHGLPPTTSPLEVIGNIIEHPRLARRWGRH